MNSQPSRGGHKSISQLNGVVCSSKQMHSDREEETAAPRCAHRGHAKWHTENIRSDTHTENIRSDTQRTCKVTHRVGDGTGNWKSRGCEVTIKPLYGHKAAYYFCKIKFHGLILSYSSARHFPRKTTTWADENILLRNQQESFGGLIKTALEMIQRPLFIQVSWNASFLISHLAFSRDTYTADNDAWDQSPGLDHLSLGAFHGLKVHWKCDCPAKVRTWPNNLLIIGREA